MGKEEYVGSEDVIDHQCRERSSVRIVDVSGLPECIWKGQEAWMVGLDCTEFGAVEHVNWCINSAPHYSIGVV